MLFTAVTATLYAGIYAFFLLTGGGYAVDKLLTFVARLTAWLPGRTKQSQSKSRAKSQATQSLRLAGTQPLAAHCHPTLIHTPAAMLDFFFPSAIGQRNGARVQRLDVRSWRTVCRLQRAAEAERMGLAIESLLSMGALCAV